MQAHGGGGVTTHYLQNTGDAGFGDGIRVAECHREFAEQYAREREAQADAHVEEMLEVARKAVHAKTSEEVQGYKLLIDALKWRASKMKPRSYGDKVTLDGEVSVRQMTDEELNRRLAYLLSEMRKPERLVDAGESTTRLLGDSTTEGEQ